MPGRKQAATLSALVGQRPHRCGSAVWPACALGDPALAKPRPHRSSNSGYHHALEPFLPGGGVAGGPRPGDSAGVGDAGSSQYQRLRLSLDRSAADGRSAPGRIRGDHAPGGSRLSL